MFLQKILAGDIMDICMRDLSTSDNEIELEALHILITTIGRKYQCELGKLSAGIAPDREVSLRGNLTMSHGP